MKPLQIARLLHLAVNGKASLRDRAWAIDTLIEAKENIGHDDLAKAVKSLTSKDSRLKARLTACLNKLADSAPPRPRDQLKGGYDNPSVHR
ncbi:MAG TPA: hypothetical protein VGG34_10535 [Opitutaceae bacterium]|jgi:hypothetical protein